jgi:hypothetical protein
MALSGEPRGSHVLGSPYAEELAQTKSTPSSWRRVVLQSPCPRLRGTHHVSDFVVQAFYSTVRTKEQAQLLLKSVDATHWVIGMFLMPARVAWVLSGEPLNSLRGFMCTRTYSEGLEAWYRIVHQRQVR